MSDTTTAIGTTSKIVDVSDYEFFTILKVPVDQWEEALANFKAQVKKIDPSRSNS